MRINASKQIEGIELLPGSWNQTIIGSVLEFPVKDIQVNVEDKKPMTADNSALSDFDISVVYAINPSSVSEIYSTKSRSFHSTDDQGNTFLMFNYIHTLVNNASYKAVRNYKSLEVADNRAKVESEIRDIVYEQLKKENLDQAISLNVVQIRNILPNADILKSASDYVRAQNELKIKETEVQIAQKEAERMAALANNSGQSIAYMNAQANLTIAEAVKNGKVNTLLIPHGMTMLGSIK
jgi:regulator of protease activity HflC (stomatin/prohibitin superfamily)